MSLVNPKNNEELILYHGGFGRVEGARGRIGEYTYLIELKDINFTSLNPPHMVYKWSISHPYGAVNGISEDFITAISVIGETINASRNGYAPRANGGHTTPQELQEIITGRYYKPPFQQSKLPTEWTKKYINQLNFSEFAYISESPIFIDNHGSINVNHASISYPTPYEEYCILIRRVLDGVEMRYEDWPKDGFRAVPSEQKYSPEFKANYYPVQLVKGLVRS